MAASKKLLYAFGFLIIASFLFGMLWPIMITDSASPSPTPQQSQDFEGQGQTTAKIASFSSDYLVECNATNAKTLLEGVEGVGLTFTVASGLYSVTGQNASSRAIFEALADYCEPWIYRNAKLEYASSLELDANTTLPAYVLNQLPAYVGGFHEEGDEIKVNVLIQVTDGQVVNAQVFEMPETVPLPEPGPFNATDAFNETNQTGEDESNNGSEEQ